MNKKIFLVLVGVLTIFAFSGCTDGSQKNLTTVEVVEKAGSSVVNIVSDKGFGSGVIFKNDGYIITNDHVTRGANKIEVHLHDNRTLKAQRIGTDPRKDLSVIKIEGENLPTVSFADFSKVKVGEDVVVIGNAQGKENTVTKGIVSNLNVDLNDGTNKYKHIQTDAAINPGNSGGALLNMKAEVIGINRATLNNSENMGYAIPINDAKEIAERIINKSATSYPYLGVVVKVDEQKNGKFLKVVNVMPSSHAAEAGLKENDFILKINDVSVNTVSGLREQLNIVGIGSIVSVRIWRSANEQFTAQIKLEELPIAI